MILDVELELVTALADPDIATRLPRDLDDRLPFTRLGRLPGSTHVDPDTAHLEAVRIGLDTYAADDITGFAAITLALLDIAELAGTTIGNIVVTAVRTQTPWVSSDPDREDLTRYQAVAVIYAHPVPGAGS